MPLVVTILCRITYGWRCHYIWTVIAISCWRRIRSWRWWIRTCVEIAQVIMSCVTINYNHFVCLFVTQKKQKNTVVNTFIIVCITYPELDVVDRIGSWLLKGFFAFLYVLGNLYRWKDEAVEKKRVSCRCQLCCSSLCLYRYMQPRRANT